MTTESANIFSPSLLMRGGPYGLLKALERGLWHLGYDDVRVIDGAGDGGADILAVKNNEQWVFQSKWSKSTTIDQQGADDLERAHRKYAADYAVLVTNNALSPSAERRVKDLKSLGFRIHVWNGSTLSLIGDRMPEYVTFRKTLRPYQLAAAEALENDLRRRNTALLILATGLGKTVVAGEVISRYFAKLPNARVLVLSHLRELSAQLECSLWRHLPKQVATGLLTGDSKPTTDRGLISATVESGYKWIVEGYRPNLVVIDETHHVGEHGRYSKIFELLEDVPKLGLTATPWRGDEFDISTIFGQASFQMGIAEGMKNGWLAQVDYRIFVDNIDWQQVKDASAHGYSLKELNRKLFLPQRDEEIIDLFRAAWNQTVQPRGILFCETIEHAEHMAELLQSRDPAWESAVALHSGMSKQQRNVVLNGFRLGRIKLITCVDVLNEGVDVPDVNVIGFLRVTHSRRIFVQQLGRGLRLAEGKAKLHVLDFVTDIRRVAAALNLRRELENTELEKLELTRAERSTISFSDATNGKLLDMWIRDAANLETAADEVRLEFPEALGLS